MPWHRYLLPYENVSPEYKEELEAFLLRFGVDASMEGGAREDDLPNLPVGEKEVGLGLDDTEGIGGGGGNTRVKRRRPGS